MTLIQNKKTITIGLIAAFLLGLIGWLVWNSYSMNNELEEFSYCTTDAGCHSKTIQVYKNVKTQDECEMRHGKVVRAGIGTYAACAPESH
jgi:hypothetical protein